MDDGTTRLGGPAARRPLAPDADAPEIAVVGAFDRFNYGDVLFTQVARHLIARHLPQLRPVFYGLRRADLTALGGEAVRPLHALGRGRPPEVD